MTHDELKHLIWDICVPHDDEENLAVCQHCWDVYADDPDIPDDDPDSLLCPECRQMLEPVEKWNIRYACTNGIEPPNVLRAILNGGKS